MPFRMELNIALTSRVEGERQDAFSSQALCDLSREKGVSKFRVPVRRVSL